VVLVGDADVDVSDANDIAEVLGGTVVLFLRHGGSFLNGAILKHIAAA
jgi:hypothetical protein